MTGQSHDCSVTLRACICSPMPNPTFFNLPNAKQQAIVDIAIAEFARFEYDSASISNIVKQAKIAKGSFYQYFEDKKDLYLYLIDLATQQKIAFLKASRPPQPQMGFFTYLHWLLSVGTQFDLSYPALSQITNRAFYGEIPFRDEVSKRTQLASLNYARELVDRARVQGDIDASIDADLAVFIINTLSHGLRDFIPQKLGLTPEQLTGEQFPQTVRAEIEQIFGDLVRVLEQGMGRASDVAQQHCESQSLNLTEDLASCQPPILGG